MLKVTENGVTITLNGKTATDDGMFWFAAALLIGAIVVAMAMSVLPIQWAIGALALLVIGSFVFNHLRQRNKQQAGLSISSGTLEVQTGIISHQNMGANQRIMVLNSDRIENHGTSLTIYDANNQKKCHLLGFENTKEVMVMEKIVRGEALNKRHANIKMKSNV